MKWTAGGLLALLALSCSGGGGGNGGSGSASEGTDSTATAGTGSATATDGGSGSSAGTDSASGTTSASAGSTGAATDTGVCGGSCVEAPAGWGGPVVLNSGALGTPLDCSPGFEEVYLGSSNLQADSYECEECACDDAGVSCDDITVSFFTDTGCDGGAQCAQVSVSQGTCTAVPAGCNGSAQRFRYTPQPDLLGGSCAPTPADPTPTLPTPEWGSGGRACAPTEPGPCPGNATCTPLIPGTYGPCIHASGDVACPVDFPLKQVLYDDYDDTRACSACACGDPMDPCSLNVVVSNDNCTAPGSDAVGLDADKCTLLGADQSGVEFGPWESCEPSGGEQTGELTPTGPTTFCCGQ